MVGVFRRSVSFPNKIPNNRNQSQKPPISHHIRSISLPCRSHPLISQIKEQINDLTTWITTTTANSKSTPLINIITSKNLISYGLTLLKQTHETLQDILQLPQTQESLRYHPLLVENLLEDSLLFVDAYGMFQTSILTLKEQHSSAQIAIRKRDESKLVLYLKAKKILVKEMEKLVSQMKIKQRDDHMMLLQVPVAYSSCFSVADTAELGRVIGDVMSLTVSVSVTLFNSVAVSFASSSRRLSWTQMVKLSRKRGSHVNYKKDQRVEEISSQHELDLYCGGVESFVGNLKKKLEEEEVRMVLKRMQGLEECICGIESVTQKIFRTFINSRVLLLNTLTLAQ